MKGGALAISAECLARLRCPQCGESMTNESGLLCTGGHVMEIRDGYVDAGGPPPDPLTARTLRSFGYEHTTFVEPEREAQAYWDYLFDGLPIEELKDGVGLDAGCGSGRFARFLAPRLRALVALDGSVAAEAAARNLAEFTNVLVVRSDLRTAPFAPGSFDFISCIGVIHHLERPEEAFRSLVPLLAPGGRILLFVYSRPRPGTMRAFVVRSTATLRRFTVHVPRRMLRGLSALVAGIGYSGIVLPGKLGERFRLPRLSGLPLAFYRHMPFRSLWLSTFDALSAPLERRYTWPEIRPWFLDGGLDVQTVRDDHGLIVLARRPGGPGATETDRPR
jgi:SAM-dependent methyltransferase